MNVLWNKDTFQKIFSTENVNLHASGDGAASRCCRLCGGESSLRAFGDSYIWDGIEQRYDQLLYNCFGIRVSTSDSLICEWCVRQLRNTERFKALVHAAFNEPPRALIPSQSIAPLYQQVSKSDDIGIIDNKELIELLKTKMPKEKKKSRRADKKKPLEVKRTNVQCKICKQKYIMMITSNDQEFVCSRCKKNNDLQSVYKKGDKKPTKMIQDYLGLHLKTNLRGKCRTQSPSKKPSQIKMHEKSPRRRIAKYKCAICPKRYTVSDHLVQHIKAVHEEKKNNVCVFCGKYFRMKQTLDSHIQLHIHQKQFNSYICDPSKPKNARQMNRFAREKMSV